MLAATSWAVSSRANVIAFDRTLDGGGRIHLVGPRRGADRLVERRPGGAAAVWSPAGQKLAYELRIGPAETDLYVYTPATRTSRRLTHRGIAGGPAWSPDGSRIAWTANRAGRLAIWVMSSDGSHKRLLTQGASDALPAWSPDGRRIAFVDVATGALEVMGAGGRASRRIAPKRAFAVTAPPAWSPDGRWIAIAGADGALYAVSAHGRLQRRLTPPRPRTIAWRPAWSPRGRTLAFVNLVGNSLELVGAGGGSARSLARHTDGLSAPSWSPDGAAVAYADADRHIAVVASDGRGRRILTHGVSSDANPAWRP